MRYSTQRKEAVLRKMMPPHNRSIKQMAQEEGICEATLYNWRKQARAKGILMPDAGPEGWNARDKFAAVLESASFNEQETAEYCRRKGIYPHQLEQWRIACEAANDWDRQANITLKVEQKSSRKRIRDLEKRTAAQRKGPCRNSRPVGAAKKSTGDLGGPRGRLISVPDRRKTVGLINTTRHCGARLAPACHTLGISARTYQRWTRGKGVKFDARPDAHRPVPANKLSNEERQRVLDICHQPEFASLPPGQIVPRLADQGQYIASESSFYRILHDAGEQHHRGRSRKPHHSTPPKGYCATAPNQVWSWDITWLAAPIRGMFFYLYMIVDIYSRKIVAWEVHTMESADLASVLVQKAVLSEGCQLDPPVLHADNGGPQKGFTLKAKLEALSITPSYSRPRVSNDNPYSESLFRTLKYRPEYPVKGFGAIETARKCVCDFVRWYNLEHLHSALRYVTPDQRHAREDVNSYVNIPKNLPRFARSITSLRKSS